MCNRKHLGLVRFVDVQTTPIVPVMHAVARSLHLLGNQQLNTPVNVSSSTRCHWLHLLASVHVCICVFTNPQSAYLQTKLRGVCLNSPLSLDPKHTPYLSQTSAHLSLLLVS